MLKNYRTTLFAVFVLLSALSVSAQNKFEGYNLFLNVPDNQKSATCALRYAAPTTDITITDLNTATPMRVSNCGDATTRLTQNGSTTATLRANAANFKWCFSGEDKSYRITFKGDASAGQITYDWIATPANPGTYNIKDFGAVGDGSTDDTNAFKSAFAFIASRNGGTLQIPEGDFVITSPVALPSGVNIQGISGITTLAPTNNVVKPNPSRITFRGAGGALFRIGECVENISIKDLELFTENNSATYGIEAVGAFLSSQNFYFERVVFQGFFRGFYAHALPANSNGWQFDYIKFNHCRFVYNRDAGIYTDVSNSDWKVEGSMFLIPKKTPTANANAMHFERAGAILIQDTFGGGFLSSIGGTFLDILDSAIVTVLNSQTEQMSASIAYNAAKVPNAGDYSYPMTLINNVFVHPIIFNSRHTLVSTGNLYAPNTFQADERLRVYSTGDRFCYDGYTLGCQGTTAINKFDRATVVFMTGQPDEGSVKGFPTFFGTDVQFGTPAQMPSVLQNALPSNKPNGSLVYCSNCRRSTTPCQAGGTGAPAMIVAGQWSCL
ncbi:MAG: glycosyl hydrolase family 28-related protein [Pyrinomonadaceae bacterium]